MTAPQILSMTGVGQREDYFYGYLPTYGADDIDAQFFATVLLGPRKEPAIAADLRT
jgi:hypothetical protein